MRKRILLVDDIEFNIEFEKYVIDSLQSEVDGLELVVDTAYTVTQAIEKIEQNEPYDAMIIDMNLPDGLGSDIAKAARKKDSNARIAALTIYPKDYEMQRGLFDLYLSKPIMPQPYKQNLARLLYI
ncbi:MAG: response regulator [Campylobacterota bacterium]|nr:response regulator [Campylobacterota bacterium]